MNKNKPPNLREELQTNKKFNPFNQEYDFAYISEFIQNNYEFLNEEDIQTAYATQFFHKYYIIYYDTWKEKIKSLPIKQDTLLQYFINITNYIYYYVSHKTDEVFLNQTSISINNVFMATLPSSTLDVDGVMEASIDTLNHISNMLKFCITIDKENLEKTEILNFVYELWVNINTYNTLKEWYDRAIWENGYCNWDTNRNQISIKIKNYDYAILRYIGLYRIQSDLFSHNTILKQELENIPDNTIIDTPFKEYKSDITIESCYIEDGYIKYQLKSIPNIDKSTLFSLYSTITDLLLYYKFILNERLFKPLNLSLLNLTLLIHVFSELIRKLPQPQVTNNFNHHDNSDFCYKIKVSDMEEYFQQRTNFSLEQIREFLQLLLYSEEDKGYNFWDKLIVQQNNYYIFPLLNIRSPNILYLIDEWLEKGGYNLKKRGVLFENHIKENLRISMDNLKYTYKLSDRKKFKHNIEEREIDIILNTKHSILVGEIKCIRHPLGVREYYNFYEKLKYGASQLNKSIDFLFRNKDFFKKDIGDIENKEIIKVVITNYPLFSGIKIDDVVIIDFSLLDMYITKGAYSIEEITEENNRIVREYEKYYYNEDEFSKKLKSHLYNSPIIKNIKHSFEINKYEMPLADDAKLHAEFIDLKEDFLKKYE